MSDVTSRPRWRPTRQSFVSVCWKFWRFERCIFGTCDLFLLWIYAYTTSLCWDYFGHNTAAMDSKIPFDMKGRSLASVFLSHAVSFHLFTNKTIINKRVFITVPSLFLAESAADVIGRKIKIAWMQIVRYELKPEKFENKILVSCLKTLLITKLDEAWHDQWLWTERGHMVGWNGHFVFFDHFCVSLSASF